MLYKKSLVHKAAIKGDSGQALLEVNCIEASNPTQLDTDVHNFGNACDAYLNNDCPINFIDYGAISSAFQSNDTDSDLNGDGVVDYLDISIFSGNRGSVDLQAVFRFRGFKFELPGYDPSIHVRFCDLNCSLT